MHTQTKTDARDAAQLLAGHLAAKKRKATVTVVEHAGFFAVAVNGVESAASFPFNA